MASYASEFCTLKYYYDTLKGDLRYLLKPWGLIFGSLKNGKCYS